MTIDNDPADPHNETENQDGKSKRWFIIVPLITLAVIIGGYFGVEMWLYSLSHISTDDARVKGTLITVSSRVAGRLTSVGVVEGQRIKRGDTIARIQPNDYQAQVNLHEAALEGAQSQLASATLDLDLARALAAGQLQRSDAVLETSQSQLAEAEKAAGLEHHMGKADLQEKTASVEEAKARLQSAKVRQDMASAEFERAQRLYQDGILAAEQLDQAAAAYEQSVAQYQSTQEFLNKSNALLARSKAERRKVQLLRNNIQTQARKVEESAALKTLAQAEQQRVKMKQELTKALQAKVKEAQAQLDISYLRLAETTIQSPVDGVVSQVIADPGEHAQPGQPIAIVNDPQDVWVEANIEETSVRKIQIGQPVNLDVDAFPQQQFQGTVIQIGAATRSEFAIIPAGSASAHFIKVTQRLPVKIAVDNRNELLKPGMMAEVGIRIKE